MRDDEPARDEPLSVAMEPAGGSGEAEVVDLLRELIRNACVNDGTPESGQEARSVGTLADYLGGSGVVVEPVPGRQSTVYRVPGTTPGAPRLLLMGHTDVVPVTPDGWSVDPFGAEIREGQVWGRGAIDMLNLTAAMAVVFRPFLRGERAPLPGDLIYLAVADEEAAGGLGAAPLVAERWDLVGTEYLLTEIAFPPLETGGGTAYPVAVGEKGPFWTHLRTKGTPGHGSQPYGRENALERMTDALAGIFATPAPVGISEEWRAFVRVLEPPADLAEALIDPERVGAAVETLARSSPRWASYVQACTHMTVSPNVLHAGVKANVIPDRAEAQLDIRLPPGQDRRDVTSYLATALGNHARHVEVLPVVDQAAGSSPTAGPLWEAVRQSVADTTGSDRVIPTLMPASTDARFFRQRGTVAYGVGLFDGGVSFGDFLAMFHGNDERVSLESLGLTVRLLDRVLERFREAVGGDT